MPKSLLVFLGRLLKDSFKIVKLRERRKRQTLEFIFLLYAFTTARNVEKQKVPPSSFDSALILCWSRRRIKRCSHNEKIALVKIDNDRFQGSQPLLEANRSWQYIKDSS